MQSHVGQPGIGVVNGAWPRHQSSSVLALPGGIGVLG